MDYFSDTEIKRFIHLREDNVTVNSLNRSYTALKLDTLTLPCQSLFNVTFKRFHKDIALDRILKDLCSRLNKKLLVNFDVSFEKEN